MGRKGAICGEVVECKVGYLWNVVISRGVRKDVTGIHVDRLGEVWSESMCVEYTLVDVSGDG